MNDAAEIRFGPLETLVGYQLRRAFLRSNQLFGALAGEVGLAPGQYGVLTLIALNPGRSQSDIAGAAGLDRSSVTQMLDQLAARGWVERQPGPDRRSFSLFITASGRSVCDAASRKVADHERLICDALTKAEVARLLDLLAHLAPR